MSGASRQIWSPPQDGDRALEFGEDWVGAGDWEHDASDAERSREWELNRERPPHWE